MAGLIGIPISAIVGGGVSVIDSRKIGNKTQFTLIISAPFEKMASFRAKMWGISAFPIRNVNVITIEQIVGGKQPFKQWRVVVETDTFKGRKPGNGGGENGSSKRKKTKRKSKNKRSNKRRKRQ